jgi:hypothetical protein
VICVAFVVVFTTAGACLGLDQFLIEHPQAAAKNPGELDFKSRLNENKDQFQQGEVIQVELSFASTAKSKYQLDGAEYDRSGRLEIDSYYLDPSSGVVDPLKDRDPGAIGGGLRLMPNFDLKPYRITRDLNEYLRIDRPGRYRLYVVSNRLVSEDRT